MSRRAVDVLGMRDYSSRHPRGNYVQESRIDLGNLGYNSTYQRLREEAYQISVGYINAPFGVGPRIQTWEPYRVAEYASALHTIILK